VGARAARRRARAIACAVSVANAGGTVRAAGGALSARGWLRGEAVHPPRRGVHGGATTVPCVRGFQTGSGTRAQLWKKCVWWDRWRVGCSALLLHTC
jgi:hypothetical protein